MGCVTEFDPDSKGLTQIPQATIQNGGIHGGGHLIFTIIKFDSIILQSCASVAIVIMWIEKGKTNAFMWA